MIIYKQWDGRSSSEYDLVLCDGWFLFGVIPLYVRNRII